MADLPSRVLPSSRAYTISQSKLSVHITHGAGPSLPPFDAEGHGKPRFLKVQQTGGVVRGWMEVGDVGSVEKLVIVVQGGVTTTFLMRGQYTLMEPSVLVKRYYTIPLISSLARSKEGATAEAGEDRPIGDNVFWFEIALPTHCEPRVDQPVQGGPKTGTSWQDEKLVRVMSRKSTKDGQGEEEGGEEEERKYGLPPSCCLVLRDIQVSWLDGIGRGRADVGRGGCFRGRSATR